MLNKIKHALTKFAKNAQGGVVEYVLVIGLAVAGIAALKDPINTALSQAVAGITAANTANATPIP